MVTSTSGVPRPPKKTDYGIWFATRQDEEGWSDLLATKLNSLVDACEYLTKTPLETSEKNHPMPDELRFVLRGGRTFDHWRHDLPGGARTWSSIDQHIGHIFEVHAGHSN